MLHTPLQTSHPKARHAATDKIAPMSFLLTSLTGLSLRIWVLTHAVKTNPTEVIRAGLWRLRGLKVRARNTIAVLAGRSPEAYRLWMHTRERQAVSDGPIRQLIADKIRIVPIILTDTTTSDADLADSCAALGRAGMVTDALVFDQTGRSLAVPISAPGVKILHATTSDSLATAFAALGAEWLCPMMAGDQLAQGAIDIYRLALAAMPAAVAYSDDDLRDRSAGRHDPHFKADWNAELFKHQDYISFACVVRCSADDLRLEAQHHNAVTIARGLTARALSTAPDAAPIHIPGILHHLKRRTLSLGAPAKAGCAGPGLSTAPRVSIIVPSKNKACLLQACVAGIDRTAYLNRELIVIDHDSDEADARTLLKSLDDRGDRVLPWSGTFNYSAMNNAAAALATGEYLCFVNNDIEMIHDDWLERLMAQAIRPEIGAVGAKLLYADGTIQHAGVVIGLGGGAGHAHRHLPNESVGYFNRPHLPQFVAAVTAACLVVARAKFESVGGFDEADFPVAFNDVDLCLKLRAAGWTNLYEPRATLTHHESKSRGSDRLKKNRARFAGELAALKRKWKTDTESDPNHHPSLSKLTEQFVIDIL